MKPYFQDKTILITGAARGIGKAAALEFARDGADVVVVDCNRAGGMQAQEELRSVGTRRSLYVQADVSIESEVHQAFARALREFGRLDVGINSAGIEESDSVTTEQKTLDQFEKIIAINVRGVFLCMREEIRAMKAAGGGSIVNVASLGGHRGVRGMCAYTASKHAVLGLTRTAALEHARSGIQVTAISPGIVDTEMNQRYFAGRDALRREVIDSVPLGRQITPEEVAQAIKFLASPAAAPLVGQSLHLDGGWACMAPFPSPSA